MVPTQALRHFRCFRSDFLLCSDAKLKAKKAKAAKAAAEQEEEKKRMEFYEKAKTKVNPYKIKTELY